MQTIYLYNNEYFSCEMDWNNMIAYRNCIKIKVLQPDEYYKCYFLKDIIKIRSIYLQPTLNYVHVEYPLCEWFAAI